MKTQIGNIKKERQDLSLSLYFSEISELKKLRGLIEKLFLDTANKIFHDFSERGNFERGEVHYWGRTDDILDGRINCVAKYNGDKARVDLKMPEDYMEEYFGKLEKIKGLGLKEDYKSLISKL